jgi:hypothetical protein
MFSNSVKSAPPPTRDPELPLHPQSDGFESGDYSGWDAIHEPPTLPNVTCQTSHWGKYCSFNLNQGSSGATKIVVTYWGAINGPSIGPEVDMRGYFRIPTTDDWGNWDRLILEMNSNYSTPGDYMIANVGPAKTDGNSWFWGVECLNATGGDPSNADTWDTQASPFVWNTTHWYCIELNTYVDNGNGWVKLYVDNVLLLEKYDLDNDYRGDINHLDFGNYDYMPTFWDDCECDTSHIGIGTDTGPWSVVARSDGFESDDFRNWDEIVDVGSLPIIVDNIQHWARYSAYNLNQTGISCSCWGYDDAPDIGSTVCVRGYFRITQGNWSEWTRLCLINAIHYASGVATAACSIGIAHFSGVDYGLVLFGRNGTGAVIYDMQAAPFSFDASHWYCIELDMNIDLLDGWYHVYLDGVEVINANRTSVSPFDTYTYPGGYVNRVDIGNYDFMPTYWDDCALGTGYIGLGTAPEGITIFPYVDPLSLLLQYFNTGDFFGFFIGLFAFAFGDIAFFYSFLAFVFGVVFYIRFKSVLICFVFWMACGTAVAALIPQGVVFGILLGVIAIGTLLFKLFMTRRNEYA